MALEIFYQDDTTNALIGYNDLTLNLSSGASRTTCRFITQNQDLAKAGSIVRDGGVIRIVDGGDTLLFNGEVETLDLNLKTGLATVSAESTLDLSTIKSNLRSNLKSILSQPPLSESYILFPDLLQLVVDDLLLTQRSKDQLIRECYQHNVIIDYEGMPHNIAEGQSVVILDQTRITSGTVRINNGRHTPKGLFRNGIHISGIRALGVEESADNLQNVVYTLGKLPIVFTDNREAPSPGWGDLYTKESLRTVIRESAELKVTMPLNLEFVPLLMVSYPDSILTAFTGIDLWTVETASHRVGGTNSTTTLTCKVLWENQKWLGLGG